MAAGGDFKRIDAWRSEILLELPRNNSSNSKFLFRIKRF